MPINIGATGTTGRNIGGDEIYRDSNLKLYLDPYRFECQGDTGTSTLYDLSGNNNDFTLANDAGRSNGHLYLDGTNDFGWRADDSDFDFGTTTDFSIQMWYRNLGSGDFWLFQKGYIPYSGYGVWWDDSASKLYMHCGYNGFNFAESTGFPWDSTWNNLALVVDRSANVKFYRNGALVATDLSVSSGINIDNANPFAFGGYNPSGGSSISGDFEGYIGPIWVYRGHLLTTDQINQNFNVHRGLYNV
jgi:hypothetical protein